MFSAIRMAAGLLFRRELHHFHARTVRIVSVQTVFAVAANFWTIESSQTVRTKTRRRLVNIPHTKREVILNSQFLVVGCRRDVQHVLDPVGTVGNLKLVPIDRIVLESAVPVQAKSQNIAVKSILSRRVVDHETGMDKMTTDLLNAGIAPDFRRRSLDEGNRIALGVANLE